MRVDERRSVDVCVCVCIFECLSHNGIRTRSRSELRHSRAHPLLLTRVSDRKIDYTHAAQAEGVCKSVSFPETTRPPKTMPEFGDALVKCHANLRGSFDSTNCKMRNLNGSAKLRHARYPSRLLSATRGPLYRTGAPANYCKTAHARMLLTHRHSASLKANHARTHEKKSTL